MFTVYGLDFFFLLLLYEKIMTCGHLNWDKIKHNNFTGSAMIRSHKTHHTATKYDNLPGWKKKKSQR